MKHPICSLITRLGLLSAVFFALTAAATAQANNCLQDVYTASGGGSLQCTANDVQLTKVTGINVIKSDGTLSNDKKCYAGQSFDFLADFEVVTTSSKTRSNIGLYFGTGTGTSQDGAKSGSCTDAIIAPQHRCSSVPTDPLYQVWCGSDNYHEWDPSPDTCGDTSSNDNSSVYGAAAQGVILRINNATCPSSGTGFYMPVCTSWQTPGKTLECVSPSPDYPYQSTAIPGSPSKCSCGSVWVDVQPINPGIDVAKSCSTSATPNPTNDKTVSCDAGVEGGLVTYTVKITNKTPANEGGVIVDQICDDKFGQVYPATGTCPTTGTIGTIVKDSASSCASLGTIDTSASCTFQAQIQNEWGDVTDTVSVSGHSSIASTVKFGPTDSNSVKVTSSDAPSTAKTNKSLDNDGPIQACVTLRFNVTVANTGAADETLTLDKAGTLGQLGYIPALNDSSSFGDITTTHGNAYTDGSVTGTTCGVAGTLKGSGTLSLVTVTDCVGGTVPGGTCNGGAFPQTLAPGTGTSPTNDGGFYTCKFDGVVCGAPGEITGVCAKGIQHTDKVAAHLTSDDGATVDQIENPLTATVCLDQSGS